MPTFLTEVDAILPTARRLANTPTNLRPIKSSGKPATVVWYNDGKSYFTLYLVRLTP